MPDSQVGAGQCGAAPGRDTEEFLRTLSDSELSLTSSSSKSPSSLSPHRAASSSLTLEQFTDIVLAQVMHSI